MILDIKEIPATYVGVQWTGSNISDLNDMLGEQYTITVSEADSSCVIKGPFVYIQLQQGYYLLKANNGKFLHVSDSEFPSRFEIIGG